MDAWCKVYSKEQLQNEKIDDRWSSERDVMPKNIYRKPSVWQDIKRKQQKKMGEREEK